MTVNKNYILYIGGFRLPDGTASAQRVMSNAVMFQELGYKVVFAGKGMDDKSTNEWFKVDDYDVYNLAYKKFSNTNINFIYSILKRIPQGSLYGIVAYNYPGIALDKLRKFCKENNIFLISEITEWYAFEPSKKFVSALLRKFQTEYRMRYVNKKIGNIICSSQYIQKYYKSYNTMLNPNVINVGDPKWNKEQIDINQEVKGFVYAGSPGKNMKKDRVDYIINAFSNIDESKNPYVLHIVGITKDQFLKQFPKYLSFLNNNDSIIFYGRVPHKKVISMLKNADFSIVFRLDTRVTKVGFATKISESISCGVPVIANDEYQEIGHYLEHGKHAILFNGFELTKLIDAVEYAIKLNKEELSAMKSRCSTDNPFSYKNFIKPTKKFFSTLSK